MSTACYLINRSPSNAIEKKTPRDIWFGGVKPGKNAIFLKKMAKL